VFCGVEMHDQDGRPTLGLVIATGSCGWMSSLSLQDFSCIDEGMILAEDGGKALVARFSTNRISHMT
jgi:hypothetical protein